MTIKKLEKAFNITLKKNCIVLGLDTATKTGYCIAKTNKTHVSFDIGFINLDVKEIKDKSLKNAIRYEELYKHFLNLIRKEYEVVVEDVYFGRNAQTLILLARIGAVAWTLARIKECKKITWRTAVQARKLLGLACNKKKEIVADELNKKLKSTLTNPDEIDALVLAIGGLVK